MDYQKAAQILNAHIFDGDKRSLIQKVAEYPERYVGLFRPTKPRAKLIQNLLQSHEIRFGDAIESLIRKMLKDMGYLVFTGDDLRLKWKDKDLSLDQFFCDREQEHFYFVEQKVRDDHDSTKKRGQISNFEDKLEALYEQYGDRIVGIMYFIDPSLQKNKSYYMNELQKIGSLYSGIGLHLFYGKEFFEHLGHPEMWDDLLGWLQQWREEIAEFPEVNMDNDSEESFEELKEVEIKYWRKLVMNNDLWEKGIIRVLFPRGTTLKMVAQYFAEHGAVPHQRLAGLIFEKMEKYYG